MISSSTTFNVALTTLTVSEPPLVLETTYYFRVGTINRAGALN